MIKAAEDAVRKGRFDSVSAWVNEGLRSKLDRDRRLEALKALLGRTRMSDVIDAALVLLAADRDLILTSDPHDLKPLAASAGLHVDIVPV